MLRLLWLLLTFRSLAITFSEGRNIWDDSGEKKAAYNAALMMSFLALVPKVE